MANYETLCRLEQSGELKSLSKSGLMPIKIGTHLEIYRMVDMRLKTGTNKKKAVIEAAVSFNLCERTVFRIIKALK